MIQSLNLDVEDFVSLLLANVTNRAALMKMMCWYRC